MEESEVRLGFFARWGIIHPASGFGPLLLLLLGPVVVLDSDLAAAPDIQGFENSQLLSSFGLARSLFQCSGRDRARDLIRHLLEGSGTSLCSDLFLTLFRDRLE